MTEDWHPNPMPMASRTLSLILFPTGSLLLFLLSVLVLPSLSHGEVKWWIVALVTPGPLLMMAWDFLVGAMQPRRILLEPEVLLYETGLDRFHRIPRAKILRLQLLENRRHGMSMCFFLNPRGREDWIPVTIANEALIKQWLDYGSARVTSVRV